MCGGVTAVGPLLRGGKSAVGCDLLSLWKWFEKPFFSEKMQNNEQKKHSKNSFRWKSQKVNKKQLSQTRASYIRYIYVDI